jgi:hypothetical protein
VTGLPIVFIELKAVHKSIRAGFGGNFRDYMDENVIAHAFHHNAFLIVSNGDNALNEFSFRFNNCESEAIFAIVVMNLVMRQALRYQTLTAKQELLSE